MFTLWLPIKGGLKMTDQFLATIEEIQNLRPHPNADRLELVDVLGFQCVVEKGIHKNGDRIIYVRTDTKLPDDLPWAEEYRKYSPSRVKAVELRKKWSEGIIVTFSQVSDLIKDPSSYDLGAEVGHFIGVTKWEIVEPIDENCKARQMPYFMRRTGETRVEDVANFYDFPWGEPCDDTLKIDGTSASYGYHFVDDYRFICNRTNEMHMDRDHLYTRINEEYGILDSLQSYCESTGQSLVIRGEIFGQGISSSSPNPHSKIMGKHFLAFSVWDLVNRRYLPNWREICASIGIETVPIIVENEPLTRERVEGYATGATKIEGFENYEGVVIKFTDGRSFKIINKKYDSRK